MNVIVFVDRITREAFPFVSEHDQCRGIVVFNADTEEMECLKCGAESDVLDSKMSEFDLEMMTEIVQNPQNYYQETWDVKDIRSWMSENTFENTFENTSEKF